MNLTIGIVTLAIGVGMIVFGRRNGSRPFMQSHLVFALYPAMTLVCLTMGTLAIVTSLRG